MNAAHAEPPFDHIVLDCDSTLCAIEGIDELARDHKAAVAALTDRAMAGELALQDVYAQRLEIVRPTWRALMELGAQYIATCVPGALDTVQLLRTLGKRVSILSGGLRPAVMLLAQHLGVPGEEVFAVEAFCAPDGSYVGFDSSSALTRDNGKPQLLRGMHNPSRIALIGDGATDLRCAPLVGRFVAFAGVVARPQVVAAARYVVRECDLRAILPLLLSTEEMAHVRADPHLLALLPAVLER